MSRRALTSTFSALTLVAFLAGCRDAVPDGTLVLTQTPLLAGQGATEADRLDARYPAGSRVVVVAPPFEPKHARVLSRGLMAAGAPFVAPDGRRIFFVGKANRTATWQVYQAGPSGGRPKRVTQAPGGAMEPTMISTGDLVFASPVPRAGPGAGAAQPPALYAQAPGGKPRRLTYGRGGALEPTVLHDGRILFVSAEFGTEADPQSRRALFTVNNDGTELSAYAGHFDGAATSIHRPRELGDGRVAFLAARGDGPAESSWAESVRTARPFASRGLLFSFPIMGCRSVEPGGSGTLLVSALARGPMGRSMRTSLAVFRLGSDAHGLGQPWFDDPTWNDLEAVWVAPRPAPMGRSSLMLATPNRSVLLCLNANLSTQPPRVGGGSATAKRVRVLIEPEAGKVCSAGEVELQADGSFLIEVPAETPLGFESLDDQGNVLRRQPPGLWVRTGESRSCQGCHEPHNHSPRNARPLAAQLPPVRLAVSPPGGAPGALARGALGQR